MSDERNNVFRYHNGVKEVFGDPLRLHRELYLSLGDPDGCFKASDGGDLRAANTINDHVREVFKMAPFDPETGAGATDSHCEQALAALWIYLEKKSLNTATAPSSSPSTTSIPTACPTK